MMPLATLPVFFKLAGQRVVVVGGSEAAAWKAELLAAAGATVTAIDPRPCPELEALAAAPSAGKIVLQRRAWLPLDFSGATFVVGAADDEIEAAQIYAAACEAGVPLNVIDKPAYCAFQFGAVVNRSPLVIGISTDGGAPVFAQAIRSRIEALLPSGFAQWAQAAKDWREGLAHLSMSVRRRFWERFSDMAFARPDTVPDADGRSQLLSDALDTEGREPGHVALVGAGPGNPELMTLKAVRALRSADIILFDDLVAPGILDFARREAKRMLVGKTGGRPSCKQDEINALMVSLAKAGKRVVRLKGGDPMIFGRANEEIGALREAGIDFEIVPGISAAQGAAASLQISLTDRGGARRLQLVTGHASDGRLPDDLDFSALADPGATTAVYMPLGTLPSLVERLTAAGVEHQRPAIAIFNATRADELVVAGTIATISDDVERRRTAGPCVLLIGNALSSANAGAKTDPGTGQGSPLGSTPRPRLHLRDRHRPVAPALRGADQAARPGRQSR
jgi:uroporphyrin-III C-methyltransferase/precorrin-2 dehydrogenase/sirohydrochlorin ferrochelatase